MEVVVTEAEETAIETAVRGDFLVFDPGEGRGRGRGRCLLTENGLCVVEKEKGGNWKISCNS